VREPSRVVVWRDLLIEIYANIRLALIVVRPDQLAPNRDALFVAAATTTMNLRAFVGHKSNIFAARPAAIEINEKTLWLVTSNAIKNAYISMCPAELHVRDAQPLEGEHASHLYRGMQAERARHSPAFAFVHSLSRYFLIMSHNCR